MTDSEHFDRAIELLLSDRSPRAELEHLNDEEQAMLMMAQLLRGSRSSAPSQQFLDRLHGQALPPARLLSRRSVFLTGLGTLAAGLLGGIGLDRLLNGSSTEHEPLVETGRGHWVHVATVTEVPRGAIRPFTAGAVQGFLINQGGRYQALSRVCTHMGCTLTFQRNERLFVCPCHGAEFTLSGRQHFGPNVYPGALSPLPEISVRLKGDSIQVWAA